MVTYLKISAICTYVLIALSWHEAIPAYSYIVQSALPTDSLRSLAIVELDAQSVDEIYPSMDIYRVSTTVQYNRATEIFKDWQARGLCSLGKADSKVEKRQSPNDPLFGEQWGLMNIGTPDVWEATTGGLTIDGDTIVVAVLDEGFNVDHIDLSSNTWINHEEIPLDNIDNDANGYVDDYRGLYLQDGNDAHPTDIHGAAVSGIIGAEGNNNRGVAGVNWSVKVLPISGIAFESDVIEGYNYVRQLRELYNSTNGEEGAFVVATNLSAGISGEWAEDYPMWCAVYEDLGSIGILNVASVTNRESLVDVEGDMPTTCPSDYLIAVTNTGMDDAKFNPAGYGPVHVDLGAPGTPTLTTGLGNEYSSFGSTSAAAPHVAGAIGLLYSADCTEMMQITREDPEEAALIMRGLLMGTVDRNASLEGRTLSGGRLNIAGAHEQLCGAFAGLGDRLRIGRIYPNPTDGDITMDISTKSLSQHVIRISDPMGRIVFRETLTPFTGNFSHNISFDAGVPGVYMVTVEVENDQITHRIVVF